MFDASFKHFCSCGVPSIPLKLFFWEGGGAAKMMSRGLAVKNPVIASGLCWKTCMRFKNPLTSRFLWVKVQNTVCSVPLAVFISMPIACVPTHEKALEQLHAKSVSHRPVGREHGNFNQTALDIYHLWRFKNATWENRGEKKAFMLYLVAERNGIKQSPHFSESFFHHTSPPLTGPYVLQCCFIRAGQTRIRVRSRL